MEYIPGWWGRRNPISYPERVRGPRGDFSLSRIRSCNDERCCAIGSVLRHRDDRPYRTNLPEHRWKLYRLGDRHLCVRSGLKGGVKFSGQVWRRGMRYGHGARHAAPVSNRVVESDGLRGGDPFCE